MFRFTHFKSLRVCIFLCVMPAVLLCRDASAASKSEQTLRAVLSIQRMVENLERNLSASVEHLNGTTAELAARIETTDRESRRLLSVAEENQVKLENLQQKLAELTETLYRHLNLSPPVPAQAPPLPHGAGAAEVQAGGIVVQPPRETPSGAADFSGRNSDRQAVTAADVDDHYRKAQQRYANEDYEGASELFDEHLQLFPSSRHLANAQYWKAHCFFKMGQYDRSIAEFDRLRRLFPTSGKVPIAMHNQAVAFSRLGQNTRAEDLFGVLIQEYPDDVATEGAREKLRQLRRAN